MSCTVPLAIVAPLYITGTALTVTAPPRHTRPLAPGAEFGTVVVATRMSALFSVSDVPDEATMLPLAVRTRPFSVQAPFLNATEPFAAVNAAVLKLSVTGAFDSSAAIGALSALPRFCVATTVSAPPQFMIRSTPVIVCVPGSTLSVTSSWPATFDKFAGIEVQAPPTTQTVWLICPTVTAAGTVAATCTTAAPETVGSAADFAMIVAVPPATAVTVPLASTVATVALDVLHVTPRFVTPAPASTDAASVTLSPTFKLTDDGVTVTLWTTWSGGVVCVGGTVTLSPQAVSPARVRSPTKEERTTRCILPPW